VTVVVFLQWSIISEKALREYAIQKYLYWSLVPDAQAMKQKLKQVKGCCICKKLEANSRFKRLRFRIFLLWLNCRFLESTLGLLIAVGLATLFVGLVYGRRKQYLLSLGCSAWFKVNKSDYLGQRLNCSCQIDKVKVATLWRSVLDP
jgi:hypothetical protein